MLGSRGRNDGAHPDAVAPGSRLPRYARNDIGQRNGETVALRSLLQGFARGRIEGTLDWMDHGELHDHGGDAGTVHVGTG